MHFLFGLGVLALVIFLLNTASERVWCWQLKRKEEEKRSRRYEYRERYPYAQKRNPFSLPAHINAITNQLEAYKYQQESNERRRPTREKLTIIGIFATAGFALWQGWIFSRQFEEMQRAGADTRSLAETAQKTLVMSQRPWLYINGDIDDGAIEIISQTQLQINVINRGNSVAIDANISSKMLFIESAGPAIDYHDIPCSNIKPHRFSDQPKAILATRNDRLGSFIDLGGKSLRAFIPRYFYPYIFGCIQYEWPVTDQSFKTYFRVPVDIINNKTGKRLMKSGGAPFGQPEFAPDFPETDLGIQLTGGGHITYFHVE